MTLKDRLSKLLAFIARALVISFRIEVEKIKNAQTSYRKTVKAFFYSTINRGLNAVKRYLGEVTDSIYTKLSKIVTKTLDLNQLY